jgi:outer membrane protein assembly factor BamB
MMWSIVSTAVLIIGAVSWYAWYQHVHAEEKAFAQALKDYDAENFTAAADKFNQLVQEFPSSEKVPTYRFLAELAAVRALVFPVTSNPSRALADLKDFLKNHEQDEHLKERHEDVWKTLKRLREELLKLTREKLEPGPLKETEEALALSARYRPVDLKDATEDQQVAQLKADMKQLEADIAQKERLRKVLAVGDRIIKEGATAERMRDFKNLARREGFADDGDVLNRLQQMKAKRLERVVFKSQQVELPRPGGLDSDPGLLIAPRLGTFHAKLPSDERVVFSLARGVLYAHRLMDGTILWATRVGIDQTALPVRLPKEGPAPERVLVLSSDDNTLTARDVYYGTMLWQHRLTAPCLSRPVIVDRRAYIPTVDGRIDEIEIAQGTFLGWYQVGEPLLVGGVRQPGTNLLYFPADSESVYVIDAANKEHPCAAILDTEHPSGSLRGEPIAVTREDPDAQPNPGAPKPGFLILCQTDGLDAMKLRIFGLPIKDDAAPLMPDEPRIRGWSWLAPYCDGETLLLATDDGYLGIFGIKQLRNDDPPLFPAIRQDKVAVPMLPGEVDLFADERKQLKRERDVTRAERAQVVRIDESDFAVLIRGELRRLHFDLYGQRVATVWPRTVAGQPQPSLFVGFPLHSSQLDENGHTLVVTTQSADGQTCLATAVDTKDGKVHWQRQLGMIPQSTPVVVGRRERTQPESAVALLALVPEAGLAGLPAALGLPLRLAREDLSLVVSGREGGLYEFDHAQIRYQPDVEWYINTRMLADPIKEPMVGPVYTLRGPQGQVYSIASGPSGNKGDYQLIVRRYDPGRRIADQFNLSLGQTPLGGSPALWGDLLVMPLADGILARVRLQEGEKREPSRDWRAKWADKQRFGYVVALSGQDFLYTDGHRKLTRLKWPPGQLHSDEASIEFPATIIAAPVLVTPDLVCVATGDGTLTLLRARELTVVREWPLGERGGKITTGPFVREVGGKRWIGCVVDSRRLVWLDPDAKAPVWDYAAAEAIVGEPEVVEGLLLVADQGGHFAGLDPRTGQRRGPGYMLRANVAPAATPVTFGTGRAFAPLSDGTVLLLSTEHFQARK